MMRSFAIALATVVALGAAQPSEAAGGRGEARSAGKTSRAAPRPVAIASRRPVAIAPRGAESARRVSGGHAVRAVAVFRGAPAQGSRMQVRAAGRREAYRASGRQAFIRYADRRHVALPSGRPGLHFVGLFSSPAAASTLPVAGRGAKYGKAARFGGGVPQGEGRTGIWHAGLPTPDGEQMDCPAGTMAVLARGHADTFRCMPM